MVLEMAGFPAYESIELTALLASAQGLGVCISLFLYGRFPRRWVLLGTMVGVIIGLALIGVAFENIASMQGLAVFAVMWYLFCFGNPLL